MLCTLSTRNSHHFSIVSDVESVIHALRLHNLGYIYIQNVVVHYQREKAHHTNIIYKYPHVSLLDRSLLFRFRSDRIATFVLSELESNTYNTHGRNHPHSADRAIFV